MNHVRSFFTAAVAALLLMISSVAADLAAAPATVLVAPEPASAPAPENWDSEKEYEIEGCGGLGDPVCWDGCDDELEEDDGYCLEPEEPRKPRKVRHSRPMDGPRPPRAPRDIAPAPAPM